MSLRCGAPGTEMGIMRPLDLLLFLFGNRGAIERIAATRHVWLVGAILVLSAGIARNYDHLDLLRNPEWIIGPFVASLFTSWFIFAWISGPLRLMKAGPYWRQQGVFLSLVWMTAPCAWLYGIPVEAFTDIVTATKWNIAFLAIVSFWRVAIMVRAVSVLTEVSWKRVLPLLLAPAALEMMVGSWFRGMSLIGIMGGVRLSPQNALLKSAADFTAAAAFGVIIVCLVCSFIIKGVAKRPLDRKNPSAPGRSLGIAAFCLLLWALASLSIQPKVANRHRLQVLINGRDYPGAAAFAVEKGKDGFPGHHYLPPAPEQRFPLELLDALPPDAPDWLREEWEGNAVESFLSPMHFTEARWNEMKTRYPRVAEALEEHADRLRGRDDLSSADKWWLDRFDRATKPAEPATPPPRPAVPPPR